MQQALPDENEFNHLCQRAGLTSAEAASLISVSDRTAARYVSGEGRPTDLALRVLKDLADRRCAGKGANLIPVHRSVCRYWWTSHRLPGHWRTLRLHLGVGRECPKDLWFELSRQSSPCGDVREYAENPDLIPEHDILLAGFPCQPFSIAGVSKKNALGRPHGFLCDTQGTLFFDTAQIIAHHRPAAFVLENVKNLESHDKGRTFATIINVLTNELGYHVQTRVISSEHWVPQRRERIFIVGFREPTDFDLKSLKLPTNGPKLGSILDPHDEVDPKYTLTPRLWEYLQAYKEKHNSKGNGFGYSLFGPDDVTRTLSARYYKDGSEILVAQPGKRPRRLTPLECARLMGFDRGDRRWKIPVSDTQAYRQFGNAVVVPVVEFLADAMKPFIESALLRGAGRSLASPVTVTRPDREPVSAHG